MTTVSTKSGRIIKVVSREEEKSTLTESDSEMDERAVETVKAAINKAKICKKPIAGYDKIIQNQPSPNNTQNLYDNWILSKNYPKLYN